MEGFRISSVTYKHKILEWHQKAEETTDIFVKFILEYIAFIAFLNTFKTGKKRDRRLIQELKRDQVIKIEYFKRIDEKIIKNLINELNREPLLNVTNSEDTWWSCDSNHCPNQIPPNNGKINSTRDFINIIEFIYRTRNNLFHGTKKPSYDRDLLIVKYGFKLLNPLVGVLINSKKLKF